jgi:hypothetical protein
MSEKFKIISLDVRVKGEITTNNLPEFRAQALAAIAKINRNLKTDEDFGQAELDVKALKSAETAIREAALRIYSEELQKLSKAVLEVAEECRIPRLEMEKLIAAEKAKVIHALVEKHLAKFDICPRLAITTYLTAIQTAVKGKRTLESMDAAAADCVASKQKEIHECRTIIASFESAHGADLIADREKLEVETPAGLSAELRRRFEAKRARDEAAAQKAKADAEIAELKAQAQAAPVIAPITPAPSAEPENPVLSAVETEPEEMDRFKSLIVSAFAPVKIARESLSYPRNIAKAQIFANSLAHLFKEELS